MAKSWRRIAVGKRTGILTDFTKNKQKQQYLWQYAAVAAAEYMNCSCICA